jgi:hypothetical protein
MAGGQTQRLIRATQMVTEDVEPEEEETTMDGDQILEEIRKDHNDSIPKATKAAYATPMKEFRAFCLEWAVEKEGKVPLDQVEESQRSLEEINR